MGDKSRGLYNKFVVERRDGSSDIGGKHYGCEYFVLDLTHDKHAAAALRAYADSCAEEYPLLAADLRLKVPAQPAEDEAVRKRHYQECWDLINAQIKTGVLQGNGCDDTAQRNGLVLATNIISAAIVREQDGKDD